MIKHANVNWIYENWVQRLREGDMSSQIWWFCQRTGIISHCIINSMPFFHISNRVFSTHWLGQYYEDPILLHICGTSCSSLDVQVPCPPTLGENVVLHTWHPHLPSAGTVYIGIYLRTQADLGIISMLVLMSPTGCKRWLHCWYDKLWFKTRFSQLYFPVFSKKVWKPLKHKFLWQSGLKV